MTDSKRMFEWQDFVQNLSYEDLNEIPKILRALPSSKRRDCVDKLRNTLASFLCTLTPEEGMLVESVRHETEDVSDLRRAYQENFTPEERVSPKGVELSNRIIEDIFEQDEDDWLMVISKFM